MRRLLIAPALAVCAGLLSLTAPAHAHTALEDAAPGPGAKVAPGVNVIALTLGDLKPGTTPEVTLLGPDQNPVASGTPTLIDNSVVCAAVTPLSQGVHTVKYTSVGSDDEAGENQFFFEVVAGAEAPETPTECQNATLAAPGTAAEEETTILGLPVMTALAALCALGALVAGAYAFVARGGGQSGGRSGGGPTGRRRAPRRRAV